MLTPPIAPKRWSVRPSGFPFGVPGQPIGSVIADDSRKALEVATAIFGNRVIVEPEGSAPPAEADPFPYKNPLKDTAAALVHAPRALRGMTSIEIQMARAVGVLRVGAMPKQWRGTARRLHAETFKPQPQISEDLAKLLRVIVQSTSSHLPPEIVESVGGAA